MIEQVRTLQTLVFLSISSAFLSTLFEMYFLYMLPALLLFQKFI